MVDIESAIQMYEKAVAIDSSFALAWVGLAESNRRMYWYHMSRYSGDKNDYSNKIQQQITRTKNYLDKAIELAPDLKEVKVEEGAYYYQCEKDYTKALQILEKLSIDYPNDDATLFWIANILRRTGEFEKSFEYYNKAISLNPSNGDYWSEAGLTLKILRKYDEAEKYIKKASALMPSDWFNWSLWDIYLTTRQIKKVKQYNKRPNGLDEYTLQFNKATIFFVERKWQQGINEIERIPFDSIHSKNLLKHVTLGRFYLKVPNAEKAKENFNTAKEIFENDLHEEDKNANNYGFYAVSLAGLGLKKEAIDTVNKALDIQRYSGDDFMDGWINHWWKADILIMVGEYDEAIKKLEYILSRYGGVLNITELKEDPIYNPLREMDGFKAIINNPEYQPR
jgi:tetratricopeptide (TPR) repeat protein